MNLSEWRIKREDTLELPSGLSVRVRKVALLDLVAQGTIPAPLLGMVEDVASAEQKTVGVADFAKYLELINVVVRAIIVDPPIADAADETHLGIDEVPFEDRLKVFNWASGGLDALASFRAQPGGDAAAGRAGEPLPPAA